MHIIIGIITAIAGLLWALNSLQNAGVNLNAFNPFTWARRRKWEKKLGTKPMHGLTDSMDAAALLVVAVAKADGEITRDTKLEVLRLFEQEFGISRGRSLELFSASTYMLRDVLDMSAEVRHVLAPSKADYRQSHIDKLLDMMHRVADFEAEATQAQLGLIDAVKREFDLNAGQAANW
ncbi:hypothetical protein [Microbulbifer litoralis]|uniref:hypothetical protein n=1 Tax=Microbulbifer litoralis TaxID=2933965 RepID=UPI002028B1C0|nr:hypothetical protein [Microbulbifer sp. GX H0434]